VSNGEVRWDGTNFKIGGETVRWNGTNHMIGGRWVRWDGANHMIITGGSPPADTGFPVFRAASSASGTGGTPTNATVALPPGWQIGDLIVGIFAINNAAGTLTAPAGWTALPGSPTLPAVLSSSSWWAGYRIATSGQAAPVFSNATGALKFTAALAAYSNAAIGATPGHASESTNQVGHSAPTITTTTANHKLVRLYFEKSSTNTGWTDPGGTTRRTVALGSGAGACSSLIVDADQAVAGSAGAAVATAVVASAQAGMCTVDLVGVV
jgi:hypothetical protein